MRLFSIIVLGFFLLLSSCSKSEGVGGKSIIKGKITVTNRKNGVLKDTYDAQAHDVYIIYGDGSIQNDDFKTSLDGSYQFEYLNKGNYQLFTYSECENCPKGQDSLILISVEVAKNETKELETIKVFNNI